MTKPEDIHNAAQLRLLQTLLEITFARLFKDKPKGALVVFESELFAMIEKMPFYMHGENSEQVKGETKQFAKEFVERLRAVTAEDPLPRTTNLIDA